MGQDDDKANLDELIDANLRRVYDSVLNEDIPDRFSDLLRRLQSGEGGGETSAVSEEGE
ncbi:MAG: NepR family anti-sigma factor [Pseudomonadota bacterium]